MVLHNSARLHVTGFGGARRPPLPDPDRPDAGISFLNTGYHDAHELIDTLIAVRGALSPDVRDLLGQLCPVNCGSAEDEYFAGVCSGLADQAERFRAAVSHLQDDWIDNSEITPRWISRHIEHTDGLDDLEVLEVADRADELGRDVAQRTGVRLPHQLAHAALRQREWTSVMLLAQLLDRFAMLQVPGLPSAVGIASLGSETDRVAARVTMRFLRHPDLAGHLTSDRRRILQTMFPGTELPEPRTPWNPRTMLAGAEHAFRPFLLAVQELVGLLLTHDPSPELARRRLNLVEDLDIQEGLHTEWVAALPPVHAGVLRHLVLDRMPADRAVMPRPPAHSRLRAARPDAVSSGPAARGIPRSTNRPR
jgi:hypothetical protein